MTKKQEQLIALLREMFQLDHSELDFGIYRIMNAKAGEIDVFLENDLVADIHDALGEATSDLLQTQLNEAVEQARSLGIDPQSVPRVLELKEQIENAAESSALEEDIYSHLVTFFSRYYKDGDFVSQRRYRYHNKDTYVIPYQGEEVKLHWANFDQYYIKTSEHFKDYVFKAKDEGLFGGEEKIIHFKLVEAETHIDNNKSSKMEEKRFVLHEEKPLEEIDGELYIYFAYKIVNKQDQAKLNIQSVETIVEHLSREGLEEYLELLETPAPTKSNKQRTLLGKYLDSYTAKNTFDYFIHKDLGSFLTRELDFYIKNEIIDLDDLDGLSSAKLEESLGKVKAFKRIARKIIDFLTQLEEFQKKLWLKKKFVIETDYCITLDRIPQKYYREIFENDEQKEEWKRLFDVEVSTVEDLVEEPYLVLDTKFFDRRFKESLLAEFDNLDEEIDGVLIKSENFGALNLLQARYKGQVKCTYNDPPYNTGNDGFLYKDRYQHSSWLSFVESRVVYASQLISMSGVLFFSIDDREASRLNNLLLEIFGEKSFIADICVVNNMKGRNDKEHIATANERLFLFKNSLFEERGLTINAERVQKDFNLVDAKGNRYRLLGLRKRGGADTREERPKMFYPIYINTETGAISLDKVEGYEEVFPRKSDNTDGCWRWGIDTARARAEELIGVKKNTGQWDVFQIDYLFKGDTERRVKPKSVWFGTNFSTDRATKELRALMPYTKFKNPKPSAMIKNIIEYSTNIQDLVLDCFAGSGTTAHATIKLNREDGGKRKYILVQMGDIFDLVTKPRVQKSIYSDNWKNGKPQDKEGVSHMFKYFSLESYEDTLNNLTPKRSEAQSKILEEFHTLREDYILHYMLDFEMKGSLLDTDRFSSPYGYTMEVSTGLVGETRRIAVDLIETFNYLLGLKVRTRRVVEGVTFLRGENLKGEQILVIWRDGHSDEELENLFAEGKTGTPMREIDRLYINGDSTLGRLRKEDEHYEVRLIEDEFKRLMFDE